ncbi:hypothetical protein D3C84_511350 [compost metagenome]
MVTADKFWRSGARYQHAADDQIRRQQVALQSLAIGVNHLGRPLELAVETTQGVDVVVEYGHVGTQADGHAGCVGTHHATADDHHLGRFDPGHAAEQHAATAAGLLQRLGTGLNRHASGHFRHGGQQGQAATAIGDGLVGDADGAAVDQLPGLGQVWRQVQVGKEGLVRAQHGALDRLGLLDLDDHLGLGENVCRGGQNFGSGSQIICVTEANAISCAALDENGMVSCCQFTYTGRNHAYAIFMVFYFLRYTDNHAIPRLSIGGLCCPDVKQHLRLVYSGIDRICDHYYKMTGDSYQKIAKGWN